MNIIVKPYGSDRCCCRPDTTWEREGKDFYVPDGTDEIYWTPVLFARISKAGKCIGGKFVKRYYDAVSYGVLLYCGEVTPESLPFVSCADHTSLLPSPLYDPVVTENDVNVSEVLRNGKVIWSCRACGYQAIENAICKASGLISLRIGDMVAVELAPAARLADRQDREVMFKATFCDNTLFDMKVLLGEV